MSWRGTTVIAVLALTACSAHADGLPESPQQLIRDVIYNELADHGHHGYFQYLDAMRTGQQTILKAEVETSIGRIHRTLAQDGKPLTAEQQEQETHRLKALLTDTWQQQKLLRDYQGDEDRIARIMGLMPDGFLYQYDGVEGENIRLTYRPNPAFKPPTYESRVFHSMAGTVWINSKEKRLSHLHGELVSDVEFGYGLLGHIDKGGTFDLKRCEVVPENWKTQVLDVHIAGHVILLKSIGKDQTERRSNFRQVPSNLTLAAAETMLSQPFVLNQTLSVAAGAGASSQTNRGVAKGAPDLPMAATLK